MLLSLGTDISTLYQLWTRHRRLSILEYFLGHHVLLTLQGKMSCYFQTRQNHIELMFYLSITRLFSILNSLTTLHQYNLYYLLLHGMSKNQSGKTGPKKYSNEDAYFGLRLQQQLSQIQTSLIHQLFINLIRRSILHQLWNEAVVATVTNPNIHDTSTLHQLWIEAVVVTATNPNINDKSTIHHLRK